MNVVNPSSFFKPNEKSCKKIYWHYLHYSGLSGPDNSAYSRLMVNTHRIGNPGFGISAGWKVVQMAENKA